MPSNELVRCGSSHADGDHAGHLRRWPSISYTACGGALCVVLRFTANADGFVEARMSTTTRATPTKRTSVRRTFFTMHGMRRELGTDVNPATTPRARQMASRGRTTENPAFERKTAFGRGHVS